MQTDSSHHQLTESPTGSPTATGEVDPFGLEVARIAHDLNNILTAINGHAEEMLRRRQMEPDDRREAGDIQTASMRGGGLMRKLLNIGQETTAVLPPLDLNEAVREHAPLIQRLIGNDLTLDMDLAAGPLFVRMSPDELTQVIMNLVTNARDAQPSDSRVVIRTVAKSSHAEHGGAVRLSVVDKGCGMTPETKGRIFDAYYTTKALGSGTGLGLTTVREIVSRLGGTIEITTQIGQGTVFAVDLPESASVKPIEQANAPGPTKPKAASPSGRDAGKLTVLLAEDEKVIRKLLAGHIGGEGHQVLVAEDGEQALQLAEAFQGEIHVLVTDIVMPKMGGAELAQAIREKRPEIKIIYMSGYAPDADTRTRLSADDVTFLAKPFAFASLRTALRQPGK